MTIFSFIYSLSNLIVYSLLVRGKIEEGRPFFFFCIGSQGFRLPLGLLKLFIGYFSIPSTFSDSNSLPWYIYCLLHKGIRGSWNVILLNSYFVSTHQNFRCKRTLRSFNKDILVNPASAACPWCQPCMQFTKHIKTQWLMLCGFVLPFCGKKRRCREQQTSLFPLPPVSLLSPGRENECRPAKGKTLWQGEGFCELSHGHSHSASCLSKGQLVLF